MPIREQFRLDGTLEKKIVARPVEQGELWLGALEKALKKCKDNPDQMFLFNSKIKGVQIENVVILRRKNNK